MNRLILVVALIILSSTVSFGQKWDSVSICYSQTLVVPKNNSNNSQQYPYWVMQCKTRSNIGVRFDFAVSNYYYGKKTSSWIGQHGGPNFNFILTIDKLNFGLRFKPWTVEPSNELSFNGHVLPSIAKLNPIKTDYFLGYSFDFEKLISVEPYLGYNRSSFYVINEDVLNQKFDINKTGGVILGTTLNKYILLKDYEYVSFFGTVGYGFVNFEKVHPDLDNGYFEWNLGIAYKGFAGKRYTQRVE